MTSYETTDHVLWPYREEKKLYCHVCGKLIEDFNWSYVDGWECHDNCLINNE